MRDDEAGGPIGGGPTGHGAGGGSPAGGPNDGHFLTGGHVPSDDDMVSRPAVKPTDPTGLRRDPGAIRAEDTEPYIGLQYIARLFKIVAMIVLVAIIAEVVAGLMFEASSEAPAWPELALNLLAEVIQGGVLSAMLWGAGDLTLLLIDVGHDVRAGRVLLGRMSARMNAPDGGNMRRERSVERGGPGEGPTGTPGGEPRSGPR
ncbi:hypothetical protein [Longimicrobium sp.]|uniref:hypothetical protein n=1 Tax=Longimicrobium sp. TaxID=2029185 RepID=UPI002EDA6658